MSLSELLEVVGGDKTTLKRCLRSLKGQGLLDYVAVNTGQPGPNQPAGLWSLTKAGRGSLGTTDDTPDESPSVAAILEQQTLVAASVSSARLATLTAALSDGELTAGSSWIARTEGDAGRYVFAFDVSLGAQPAENLRAALNALGFSTELSTVRTVQSAAGFVESLRAAQGAAARAVRGKPSR